MTAGGGYVPVLHAGTADRPDEIDTLVAAEAVAAALERLGYDTAVIAVSLDLSVLEALARRPVLAVFNLVEAMRGDDRLIGLVPAVLEHLGLAFTGGDAAAFAATLSKCKAKQLLRGAGVSTTEWSVDGRGCDPAARYIVKTDVEHGSFAMDAASVVPGAQAAGAVAMREAKYGVRFFAERFIDGREFNVALLGGAGLDANGGEGIRVLPIQEILFEGFADDRPRIVDYDAKWDVNSTVYHATPRRFGIEAHEPALAHELVRLSRAAWRALDLGGYARVDFRVDPDGLPFVLEVNVNPAITPDAGLVAAAAEAGMSYDDLVGLLVGQAVARATAGAAARQPMQAMRHA